MSLSIWNIFNTKYHDKRYLWIILLYIQTHALYLFRGLFYRQFFYPCIKLFSSKVNLKHQIKPKNDEIVFSWIMFVSKKKIYTLVALPFGISGVMVEVINTGSDSFTAKMWMSLVFGDDHALYTDESCHSRCGTL